LKHAQESGRDGKTPRNGQSYLTTDPELLRRGKIAFADNCAQCHSSKQPADLPSDPELRKGAWRQLVLRDDFLVDNYLSDDERYPLSELGTNAARAAGTNALARPYVGTDVQPRVQADEEGAGQNSKITTRTSTQSTCTIR